MIERPIDIVCRGHGTHRVRELVVLVPVEPRVDLHPMALEAGVQVPEETADERRGFGVRESLTKIEGGKVTEQHKSDARLVLTPGVGWQVVHQGCPTCRSPLILPVAQVVAGAYPRHDGRGLEIDVRPV